MRESFGIVVLLCVSLSLSVGATVTASEDEPELTPEEREQREELRQYVKTYNFLGIWTARLTALGLACPCFILAYKSLKKDRSFSNYLIAVLLVSLAVATVVVVWVHADALATPVPEEKV